MTNLYCGPPTDRQRVAARPHPTRRASLGLRAEREQPVDVVGVAEGLVALDDAGEAWREEAAEGAQLPEAFVAETTPALLDALARLVETLDDPVGRSSLAPLIRREIGLHLLRGPAAPVLRAAAARDNGRIRRALVLMKEHVSQRCTIEQLARHVGMSPSHFAHRERAQRSSLSEPGRQVRIASTRAPVRPLGPSRRATPWASSIVL